MNDIEIAFKFCLKAIGILVFMYMAGRMFFAGALRSLSALINKKEKHDEQEEEKGKRG